MHNMQNFTTKQVVVVPILVLCYCLFYYLMASKSSRLPNVSSLKTGISIISTNGSNVRTHNYKKKGQIHHTVPTRLLITTSMFTDYNVLTNYFSRQTDVIYVDDPGLRILTRKNMPTDASYLDHVNIIQAELMETLRNLFTCDFKTESLTEENHIEIDSNTCRSKALIITTSTLYSIMDIEQLMENQEIKILKLVRDPRSVASCLKKTLNTPKRRKKDTSFQLYPSLEKAMLNYCDWMIRDYGQFVPMSGMNNPTYMLLRLEDLHIKDTQFKNLVEFTGIDITNDDSGKLRNDDCLNWKKRLTNDELYNIKSICKLGSYSHLY
ncbi:uncharacterized protein LOC144364570 [Saccoglossus kowalevskii]